MILKSFVNGEVKLQDILNIGHTAGVDATTGPLGQGIAMGVGMAMAERHLAAIYNKENYEVWIIIHIVICGDGDLMEGVSAEAASLSWSFKIR